MQLTICVSVFIVKMPQ